VAVTSHDVARLAGVSQATVSRALRDDARVTAATRRRVRDAAATLGYVPSELGRGLSTRTTRRVALVVELHNTLYHQLMAPIHDELAARGYRMSLLAERDDASVTDRLLDRSVDGAILMTTRLGDALPEELGRRGLPFVFLNRLGSLGTVPSASADNVGGAEAAGALLFGAGHRNIGVILGPADTSTSRDREAGYRRAFAAADAPWPAAAVVRGEFDHAGGRAGVRELFARSSPPTAVLCANDHIAIGALSEAAERGMRVPDDLAVVGFDDIDMAAWPAFRLTTVHNPLMEMAARAAAILLDGIEHPGSPAEHVVFPTSVVLRATHG
jgi:LacI family transcriptional regulator, galactose operon repressor